MKTLTTLLLLTHLPVTGGRAVATAAARGLAALGRPLSAHVHNTD